MYVNLRKNRFKKSDVHVSRWFITINTNRSEKEMIKRLKTVYEAFWDNIKRFIIFIEEGPLLSMEDDPVIGIGKTFNRVHIHSLITIRHEAKIHLDYDKIREFFGRLLGLTIHFDARPIRDTEVGIRKYLMKNYREVEDEDLKELED